MPHAWIEYSANLSSCEEVRDLGKCIYNAMIETNIFPVAGIRIRINQVDEYLVGDCEKNRGFVHLSMRIGEGRDEKTIKRAADLIFEHACERLKKVSEVRPLAFAFELQEIPSTYSYKMNTIRQFIG